MKIKHNKKRNTAFIYEALIKEATAAVLRNDINKKKIVFNIVKKHFKKDSILRRDLECYTSLYEDQGLDQNTSEKIIREAKIAQRLIDPSGLFKHQTDLIKDINIEFDGKIFNNFVPNYKTLATISQIFSGRLSPKKSIMLEQQILNAMIKGPDPIDPQNDIDNITIKTFIKKFNDKYDGQLLPEQKELISYYISSFIDNSLSLKMFLNEELSRLKQQLNLAKNADEIKKDKEMLQKTDQIIEKLSAYVNPSEALQEDALFTIMKTQKLIKEIYTDGNNN
tara:strand:- start:279 stop:1118 length:840 start_codon:yes stop_codon:yes gene_type:complete